MSGDDGHLFSFETKAKDYAGLQSENLAYTYTRVDSSPPTAWVSPMPSEQSTLAFGVSWTGSDTRSGLASFTIQVRVDGGAWGDWLVETTSSSSAYVGLDGHAYGFRVRALDQVGNVGEWSSEVVTTIQIPPTWKAFISLVMR
jgi:hypothetical protein